MVITIAGYKGGIGKTTTAIHLAAVLSQKARTLLIDADENRSAYSWASLDQLPFKVSTEDSAPETIAAFQPEHIVVDTKARPSPEDLMVLSKTCDLMLLPTTTRPMDFQALIKTVQAMKAIEAPYRVLLTMVPPISRKVSAEIREVLKSANISVLESVIHKYAFIEQLPLDGILASDIETENAYKVWQQYVEAGKELMQ